MKKALIGMGFFAAVIGSVYAGGKKQPAPNIICESVNGVFICMSVN